MPQTITTPTVEDVDALAHSVSAARRDTLDLASTVAALSARVDAWHPTPVPPTDPPAEPDPPTNPDPPTGLHAYFETHLDHPALIADYSLRDQGQLNEVSNQAPNSGTVTYDPAHDDYHTPQDAAKIVIPQGFGSLRPFPMLPIHVNQGSVLTVWDHWWGPEFLDPMPVGDKYNHKQFVYLRGNDNDRWVEMRAHFIRPSTPAGALAAIDMRSYGQLTDTNPDGSRKYEMTSHGVVPREGGIDWYAMPETWTRYFWLAEQLGTPNATISLWMSDEGRAPVCLYKRVTVAWPNDIVSIDYLRCQYNSSQGRVAGSPDLVAYMRDVLVFRDLTFEDVEADPTLLKKPTAEG